MSFAPSMDMIKELELQAVPEELELQAVLEEAVAAGVGERPVAVVVAAEEHVAAVVEGHAADPDAPKHLALPGAVGGAAPVPFPKEADEPGADVLHLVGGASSALSAGRSDLWKALKTISKRKNMMTTAPTRSLRSNAHRGGRSCSLARPRMSYSP